MNFPVRSERFVAVAAAVLCALFAAAACSPSGPIRARLPDAVVAEAPWEAAFAPEELTEDLSGVLMEPAPDPQPGAAIAPAAGALVELLIPRPDGRGPLVKVAETVTGPDGAWHLGKAPHDVWAVRGSKAGMPSAIGGSNLRVPGAVDVSIDRNHRMGLQRPRTVRGRVVLRDGRPLEGVPVEAVGITYSEKVLTGPGGTFEFRAPDSPLRISTAGTTCDVVRQMVPSESSEAALETFAAPEFAGRVVAAEDLRPIAGARIVWLDDPSFTATADDDGHFRLAIPRAGRVAAFAAGRAWRGYAVPRAAELEILLHRAASIQGTVVDADGKPAADVRLIGVTSDLEGAWIRVNGPRTDADGSFDFSWLPVAPAWTGKRTAIVAWHRRLGVSQVVVLPAKGPVTLRLSGFDTVRGTLVDGSGRGVAFAEAYAKWRLDPLVEAEAVVVGIPTARHVLTAADGSFVVPGVPRDRSAKVGTVAYGVELDQVFESGAARDAVRFALPEGRLLAGRVVDWKGAAPGAPATVSTELLDVPGVTFERTVVTGPDGAFTFRDVPPGRYSFRAQAEGFDLIGGAGGHAGDEDVKITVRRSARVSARLVVEGGGVPPVPLTAWIDDLDEPSRSAGRRQLAPGAAEGVFDISTVYPGRYRVRVEGDVWRGRVDEIVLGDGEVRTVDVPLVRTLKLRGVLLDDGGQPLAGETVTVVPATGGDGELLTSWSADGGIVDVSGVVPGRWVVKIGPRNRAPFETTVTLPSDTPFEFRLPPCGDVVIRVRGAAGESVKGAIVGIDKPDGTAVAAWGDDPSRRNFRFRADDEGNVTIRGVPTGRFKVHAAVDKTRLAPKDVVVEAGKTVEVVLE